MGLRWWNEADVSSGDSHWVFESADPDTRVVNGTDKRFFWLALYTQPLLWVGLAVVAIVRLEFIWLSLVGMLPFTRTLHGRHSNHQQSSPWCSRSQTRLPFLDATSLVRLRIWPQAHYIRAAWRGTLLGECSAGYSRGESSAFILCVSICGVEAYDNVSQHLDPVVSLSSTDDLLQLHSFDRSRRETPDNSSCSAFQPPSYP